MVLTLRSPINSLRVPKTGSTVLCRLLFRYRPVAPPLAHICNVCPPNLLNPSSELYQKQGTPLSGSASPVLSLPKGRSLASSLMKQSNHKTIKKNPTRHRQGPKQPRRGHISWVLYIFHTPSNHHTPFHSALCAFSVPFVVKTQ